MTNLITCKNLKGGNSLELGVGSCAVGGASSSGRIGGLLSFILSIAFAFVASGAWAATNRDWIGGSGGSESEPLDIYKAENWPHSTSPTTADNLKFKFDALTYLTSSMDNAAGVAVCNEANFNGGTSVLLGAIRSAGTFRLAQASGETVEVQVAEGGTLYSGGILAIGCGGTAMLTVNGGTVYSAGDLRVGNGSTATLTINSGTVEVVSSKSLGLPAQGTGTINLDGGTLKTKCIKKAGGSSGTLNFNGGTLQANADNTTDFINENLAAVNVLSGGGTIDANGYSVKIAKSLSGEGAMTFKGGGTVTLADGCDCAGGTTIELGTKVSAQTATAQKILSNLTIDGRVVLAGGTYDVLVASGLTAADTNNITLVNCAGAATVGFDNDTMPTKIVVTLEEPTCVTTSASSLAFPDTTLAAIKYADFTARMCGQLISAAYNVLDSAKGYNKKCYYDGSGNLSSIVVEFQVVESGHTKCIVVEFTQIDGSVYAKALGARYIANQPLGYEFYTRERAWNGTQKTVAPSCTAADYGACDFRWTPGEQGVTAWTLDANTKWSALRNGATLASDEIVQITVTDADAVLTLDEDVNVGLIEFVNGTEATLSIDSDVTVSAYNYNGLGYVLNNGTFQKGGDGTVELKFDNASRGVFVVNSGTLKAVGKKTPIVDAGTPITGNPDVTSRSTFLIDVKRGAIYDVNGQTSVSACVRLAEGAHFISSGSDPNVTHHQTLQLILSGDAGVTANGIFGIYNSASAGGWLDIGSHTLTVKGKSDKQFMLANTTITGHGTISVVSGKLAVRNNYNVIGTNCTVSIGSGGTLYIAPPANKLSVRNFVNGGEIDIATQGTLEVAGTLMPGSAAIPKLTLASGATIKATGTAQVVSGTFTASGKITVDASEITKAQLDEGDVAVLTVPAAFNDSGAKWEVSGEQVAGTRTKWRTDADDATKTLYIARPSGLMVIFR